MLTCVITEFFSRHFKVINRTLELLTYHVAMYLHTVAVYLIKLIRQYSISININKPIKHVLIIGFTDSD